MPDGIGLQNGVLLQAGLIWCRMPEIANPKDAVSGFEGNHSGTCLLDNASDAAPEDPRQLFAEEQTLVTAIGIVRQYLNIY